MKRLKASLVAAVVILSSYLLASPAVAQECHPEDGEICCETTADKVNAISRRYTGQDLLLCTQ